MEIGLYDFIVVSRTGLEVAAVSEDGWKEDLEVVAGMDEDIDEDSSVFFGVFIGKNISLLDLSMASNCRAGNFIGIVAGMRGLEIICFTAAAAGFKYSDVDFVAAIILGLFTDMSFVDITGSMDCFKGAENLDMVAAVFTDTGIAVDLSSLLISDFLIAADSVDVCSSMDCFRRVEGVEMSDLITAESMDIVILLRATGSMVFSCSMGIVSDGCSGDFTLMDAGKEGMVITAGFTVDSTGMDKGLEDNLDGTDGINGVDIDSSVFHNVLFIFFLGRLFSSRKESTFTVFLYTEDVDIIDFALYMTGLYFTGFKPWKCLLVWSKNMFTQILGPVWFKLRYLC